MWQALKRYLALHRHDLADAGTRIVRQPGGTVLTVLVIAIALALPAGLRVIVNNLNTVSGSWESAADFTAYLAMHVSEDEARELASRIESREDVEQVVLVGRDAALDEFRMRSGFGEALDALEENPLPHALVVRPSAVDPGAVEALAGALDGLEETDLVQVDTAWVERLQRIVLLVRRVVDIAAVLLGLAVVLVIGNTIRLEINNRRTEIEVMKLVGGSDAFIRRPFLYLGLCYGLYGAVVAMALVALSVLLLAAPVRELAELYASDFRLAGLSLGEAGTLIGAGAALGWAGAWLAAARHLRSIEPA